MDVGNIGIEILKLGIPISISLYALWQTQKGPDIVFIGKDHNTYYETKLQSEAKEIGVNGAKDIIVSREEAYFSFTLVFLNKGTKGGTVTNLSLKPLNIKEGETKDTFDYIEFEPYFRDSQGKDLPKSAVHNIHGNESIGIPVGCVIRLWGKDKRGQPKDHVENILREQKNVLQLELSYERTKVKKNYLRLFGEEACLEKSTRELTVTLNKK